jgi:hypothetical protein
MGVTRRGLLLGVAGVLGLSACSGIEEPAAPRPVAARPAIVLSNGRAAGDEGTDEAARRLVALTEASADQARAVAWATAAPTHTARAALATAAAQETAGAGSPRPAPPRPAELRRLAVPYRSQLDGNPYAESDCGPASMAMVLAYFGRPTPTRELRAIVNDLQGTWGVYDAGTTIENLAVIAERYNLRPLDLRTGSKLRHWTVEELKAHLDAGHPVVPQLWYRGLPGREGRPYDGDHYLVVVGYAPDGVLYHDPVDRDGPGAYRRMTWSQLDKAWRNSDFPYAALAVGQR